MNLLSRLFDPAGGQSARIYGAISLCFIIASLCLFRFTSGSVTRYVGIALLFGAGLLAWLAEKGRYSEPSGAPRAGRGVFFLVALGVAALVGLMSLSPGIAASIRHTLVVVTRALLSRR